MDAKTPTSEKAEVEQFQDVNKGNLGTEVEVGSVPVSFVDIDKKKVLRKVCSKPRHRDGKAPNLVNIANSQLGQMDIRLIPMLAALYLLSFLDRK